LRVLTMYAIFCTTQKIQVILNNDKYFLVKKCLAVDTFT